MPFCDLGYQGSGGTRKRVSLLRAHLPHNPLIAGSIGVYVCQVTEDLFSRLKAVLARNGMKQKDFLIGLIEDVIEKEEAKWKAESEEAEETEMEDPETAKSEPDEESAEPEAEEPETEALEAETDGEMTEPDEAEADEEPTEPENEEPAEAEPTELETEEAEESEPEEAES